MFASSRGKTKKRRATTGSTDEMASALNPYHQSSYPRPVKTTDDLPSSTPDSDSNPGYSGERYGGGQIQEDSIPLAPLVPPPPPPSIRPPAVLPRSALVPPAEALSVSRLRPTRIALEAPVPRLNPDPPRTIPVGDKKLLARQKELEENLGVSLAELTAGYEKLLRDKAIRTKAEALRVQTLEDNRQRFAEEAINEVKRMNPIEKRKIAEEKLLKRTAPELSDDQITDLVIQDRLKTSKLKASQATPTRDSFIEDARQELAAQPSAIPSPLERMMEYDATGGRAPIDRMLRDLLNETSLEGLSGVLAEVAKIDKGAARQRLIEFVQTIFKKLNENEVMFPRQEHSEVVKSLLDEPALREIDAMGRYACLDADTFASVVNSPEGVHKFILNKMLSEADGRSDVHLRALVPAQRQEQDEASLKQVYDGVVRAGAGVCTTLAMAAGHELLQASAEGRLPGIDRIELVSGQPVSTTGHVYVVLNRSRDTDLSDSETWLKPPCIVVDPWAGTLGCKTTYTSTSEYPAGLRKYLQVGVKSLFDRTLPSE